jgi:hypothetical protein
MIFIFVDGIGIGPATPSNPFHVLRLPAFERLSGNRPWIAETVGKSREHRGVLPSGVNVFRAIDANLGVEGLPQSGTGQASLYSGVNCARLAGRHFGPFPHSTSLPVLSENSIFARLRRLGYEPAFANAYPPVFFEMSRKRDRWPVTTRACLQAGVRLRTLDDLRAGNALSADITGEGLKRRFDGQIEVVDEGRAADRLVSLSKHHGFVAFEYFHTDRAGHRQSADAAAACLRSIDRLLGALAARLDKTDATLVLTSDHGNLEDLSVKTHTRNPVPFLAVGPEARAFASVKSLVDVVPAVVSLYRPEAASASDSVA